MFGGQQGAPVSNYKPVQSANGRYTLLYCWEPMSQVNRSI
jgi:hypothetical protein